MIAFVWALAAITLLTTSTTSRLTTAQNRDATEFNYTLQEGYPIGSKLFGNIAGIDVDKAGNIVIFHRGSHVWTSNTFDANDVYIPDKDSPIREETVVTVDPLMKKVVTAWGRDRFYMPHGLSLDLEKKHVWLTDVALHQAFKFTLDGEKEVITLGTAFVPGNDESHFCKPTSVADTGDYVFVADGYCNSRIVMFSAQGRYLSEFGQSPDAAYLAKSSRQPTFNIPHKIVYAKEADMICVADRENGRIQCFSFEPRKSRGDRTSSDETGVVLSQAIELKFVIADPLFNGRLFSIDYSPYRGGMIAAVSGESLYSKKPPLGFVYNVTTQELISKFSPPKSLATFGMAHDVAFIGDEAETIYVVDTAPVNVWKFSRPMPSHKISRAIEMASRSFTDAVSLVREKEKGLGFVGYLFLLSLVALVVVVVAKARRSNVRYSGNNSFAALYSNAYPASVHSLFGNNRFPRRPMANGSGPFTSTLFSRRAFFNLFDRRGQDQANDFSRIPLEESDNSDNDKSDSDVEEFNINEANPNVKIDV